MSKAAIITDDPRLNYMIAKPDPSEFEPLPEGVCGIAPNTSTTTIDKYDFYVPLPDDPAVKSVHEEPLLLSFLQIKEGDIDAGMNWYRHHYPKLPDELIEIMARYNFGDLKYATRKSIRNNTKKFKKKNNNTNPDFTKGLTKTEGPIVVQFD